MIAEARVFYLRAVRRVPFVRLCADGEGFVVLEVVAGGDDLAAHVALFDNPTVQRANDGGMRAAQGNDLVKVNVGLVIAPDVVEDVADADTFRVGRGLPAGGVIGGDGGELVSRQVEGFRAVGFPHGGQSVGVALTAVGWTLTGCFGITALVLGILTAVGAGPLGLSPQDFIALPILTAVFTPATLGFLFMAIVGMKKLTYFSRLRRLLRAANDWTCDLPSLARKAQIKQETAYATVTRAVGSGDLPNAAISDDYSTLYLDDSLMPTAAKPADAPQAEPAEPLTDAEQFRREGMDFLNYLKVCRGKLGTDADEELAAMQKTCASIMGFVHNHPEQLNRVRRFREYYLPTTRKLLDTAQGLGDTDSANAAEIRRDITGILHTLNQAYEKLYDTLLQDVSMDVSTEIDTLEAMLRQDGLTHDFEADFNTRS